ncbi:lipid droplet-associated hydrolase-like [Oscarella lobularis]|uniref:lipid droplet-associated hydrolase-like n=1 Tax=Oscarella lobularis TaxID=121494 RepID=UPI0033136071
MDIRLPLGFIAQKCSDASAVNVVIVPGNPGILDFYRPFVNALFFDEFNQKANVYAIGHLHQTAEIVTHASVDPASIRRRFGGSTYDELNPLEKETLLKVTFIETQLDSKSKLILIGHSVGAYLVLQTLRHIDIDRVTNVILLFPTVERMLESPNGQRQHVFFKKHAWLPIGFAKFMSLLPNFVRRQLCQFYMSWCKWVPNDDLEHMVDGVMVMGHGTEMTERILTLAHCEMNVIVKLSSEMIQTISRLADRIVFFYAVSDGWVPNDCPEKMAERFPSCHVERASKEIDHDFCLTKSREVAKRVADFVGKN